MTVKLSDLVRASPAVVPMTKELRAESLKTGCEPTCHMCKKLIELGTEFGFFKMPTGGSLLQKVGLVRAASVMACRTCLLNPKPELIAEADKDIEKREAEVMRAQLTMDTRSETAARQGAIFIDDGDGTGPRAL